MHPPADRQLHLIADLGASERMRRVGQDRVERRLLASAGNRAGRPGHFATEVRWSNQAIGSEPTPFRTGS